MDLNAAIERIAGRYPSRWTQGYVRGKIRSDPVYHIARKALASSDLPVLDIGCGMGFLAFFLRESGFTAPIFGLDFDAAKISSAQKIAAVHYHDLHFAARDATEEQEFCGNVIILDMLQYLTGSAQIALLDRVAGMIPVGGMCLLRCTPRDESWRFGFTRWMDNVMHRIRWMKSMTVDYLTVPEIAGPFVAAGFRTEIHPLWGKTPFNSYLMIFRKSG